MHPYRNNYRLLLPIVCACVTIISVLTGCRTDRWHREQGMIWNTVWHATYEGEESYISACMDSLEAVGASLSVFDEKSLVSRMNSGTDSIADRHFSDVYVISKYVNVLSGGMFDPTVSPLVEAWGFGKNRAPEADSTIIASRLAAVGIHKTRLEGSILHKDNPDITFNFSAIAKGYGVDKAAEALASKGVGNLMFEIGGEVVCRGKNPDGSDWRILIETPDEEFLLATFGTDKMPEFSTPLIVTLSDEALATSGNYRNYHKDSGRTFGHTISPLTGYPVESDLLSASVIAPTCVLADALATACMGMGSEKGMEMLDKEGVAGAFILNTGKLVMNDNMRRHLHEEKTE
ncbi:MAG: FAD:protein FMN transferase [Muribaculaceae bacterium]|nr:FAD:protein FMN transferase [Muribaculaceae bacterium]